MEALPSIVLAQHDNENCYPYNYSYLIFYLFFHDSDMII